MGTDFWKEKLTPFDAELCRMVESITEMDCEPKNGGEDFFIECNYQKHNKPEFILGLWDAIEGRVGKRLIEIKDCPESTCLLVRIKFYEGECKEASFIPKRED